MTTALLLIDIQNDYFPDGRRELVGAQAAGARAKDLLVAFREIGWPVIHVRHVANEVGATFFLPDTDGAEIHELVTPMSGEVVITKHTPNAFLGTDLRAELDELGVRVVVVAGMMTHMCVDSTTRAASDLGFVCSVAGDACATYDQWYEDRKIDARDVHAAFLSALADAFATVESTADLVNGFTLD